MLGRVEPLDRLASRLLLDDIHPPVLDLLPAIFRVLPPLILDGLKPIILYVAGEYTPVAMRHPGLEDENGGRHSLYENILRKLDDFQEGMLLKNPPRLRYLLHLLIWEDKGANGILLHVVQRILHYIDAPILILKRRVHQHPRGILASNPPSRLLAPRI